MTGEAWALQVVLLMVVLLLAVLLSSFAWSSWSSTLPGIVCDILYIN
jgi:hypothetical protein